MVGPDIEVGTGDSKMERIHSFSTFTKASERFRKFKKITRLCDTGYVDTEAKTLLNFYFSSGYL